MAESIAGAVFGIMMPLVAAEGKDPEQRLQSRIRNTRKLLTAAAVIMSGYLIATSVVTTVLIPAIGRRFAPEHTRGLAPCGRLDIDSVGLLVLTQDGRIARQLIGENSGIEKEYLVRVHYAPNGPHGAGVVTQDVQAVFPADKLALLRHGLSLDDLPLKPAQVDWMNPEQLRFILKEGKKRQIRRMCEQVGLHVVGLKRIRIGKVVLGNLPVGQWRYLGAGESF